MRNACNMFCVHSLKRRVHCNLTKTCLVVFFLIVYNYLFGRILPKCPAFEYKIIIIVLDTQ